MTGFVKDAAGQAWQLPGLLGFELEYGVGTPCDSFSLRCPWQGDSPTAPGDWVEFYAEHEGRRVFTGVVDECEVVLAGSGLELEVAGRGMAARLLDNEALGQDYDVATWADIVAEHVAPYGVEVLPGAQLPHREWFRVETGSSEWTVLAEFCQNPLRFDGYGRLDASAWRDGAVVLLDASAPVTKLVRRDRRYGVLSEILVRDRFSGQVRAVRDEEFLARGGRARRVVTMPGRAGTAEMIRAGEERLKTAAREGLEVEVTLARPFYAMPGELVRVERGDGLADGLYRAARCAVGLDGDGYWTRLTLRRPEYV